MVLPTMHCTTSSSKESFLPVGFVADLPTAAADFTRMLQRFINFLDMTLAFSSLRLVLLSERIQRFDI